MTYKAAHCEIRPDAEVSQYCAIPQQAQIQAALLVEDQNDRFNLTPHAPRRDARPRSWVQGLTIVEPLCFIFSYLPLTAVYDEPPRYSR